MSSGSVNGVAQDGLLQRLPALAQQWREGRLAPPAFAALYFLHWQMALHGAAFAARRRRGDARPDARAWLEVLARRQGDRLSEQLLDFLERYQFRDVSAGVVAALCGWLRDHWSLDLREDVPAAREVLLAQARGWRPVTVVCAYPRMLEPVLHKPHAFAFLQHDLEHAYKYFHAPALHAAQRAFFAALASALERGLFDSPLADPAFATKFDYLAADMNTHPEHSRQYLRAILIEYYARREGRGPAERVSSAAAVEIATMLDAVRPSVVVASGWTRLEPATQF